MKTAFVSYEYRTINFLVAICPFIHVYYKTFEITYFFKYHISYCNNIIVMFPPWCNLVLFSLHFSPVLFPFDMSVVFIVFFTRFSVSSSIFILSAYHNFFFYNFQTNLGFSYFTYCYNNNFNLSLSPNSCGVIGLHNVCSHVICPTLLYCDCSCWTQDERPCFTRKAVTRVLLFVLVKFVQQIRIVKSDSIENNRRLYNKRFF